MIESEETIKQLKSDQVVNKKRNKETCKDASIQ